MRTLKFYLILLIVSSLLAFKFHPSIRYDKREIDKKDNRYKVYKIDSVKSYYLIYVRKGDSIFKVVSKKERRELCKNIILNNYYEFKLHSQTGEFKIGNITVPVSLDVNCFAYDDSTYICLEGDPINALYQADNIKGLCFLEDK